MDDWMLPRWNEKKKWIRGEDIGVMQNGERSRHNFALQKTPFPLDSILGIWSGSGIEGSARIFAEEMTGDGRGCQEGQRGWPTGRRAGKRKRMYICRLSERIKTERIANGFPFQSVDHRGYADSFVLPLSLSVELNFFQISRLSVFEVNVKQSDSLRFSSVLWLIKLISNFECETERVNKISSGWSNRLSLIHFFRELLIL